MYKLLKPLPKAFQAMLVEFQEYIADTGLDQVKSLHTENVSCQNSYFILYRLDF